MCESVKNDRDDIWLKDLSIVTMDVWARSSEQECVKRLSIGGVTTKGVGLQSFSSG